MALSESQIALLLLKKINGQITPEESALLEEWKNESVEAKEKYDELTSLYSLQQKRKEYLEAQRRAESAEMPFVQGMAKPVAHRVHFLKTAWFRYAAAAMLCVAIGAYLWTNNKEQARVASADILPGREGAILTLADGRTIVLDSLHDGEVADQNGTKVLLDGGTLAYNAGNANTVTYNTMTTPKCRQFSLRLPDGSRAWLNAGSSITYPTVFIEAERTVRISGEVYFEIEPDKKMPFVVKVNDQTEIRVLGTRFNISAYSNDSSINTTLLEGSVQLNANNQQKTLTPGQQAQVMSNGKVEVISDANIQKIMAWKNGYFNFDGANLVTVMRQLERWYDIEVKYAGDPPVRTFGGELPRNLTLMQVIETLREMGLNVKVEGRVVTVMP